MADVEACAADIGLANEFANTRITGGSTTLPAAQALRSGLAIELRVHGCVDHLRRVIDDLAQGLDKVREVEKSLTLSRAALAQSEAALAASRTAERTAGLCLHDKQTGLLNRKPFHDCLAQVSVAAERRGSVRDRACELDDAGASDAADPSAVVIKVLVAEDESSMRDLVHRVLTGAGMQLVNSGPAAELLSAEKLASATIPRLYVKMPGMSGMAGLSGLAGLALHDLLRNCGVHVPVVSNGGGSDMALALTAMRNGAAEFAEMSIQRASQLDRVRRSDTHLPDRMAILERPADPEVMARFETLTPREREVFNLLVTGMSSKLIARELGGSFRTIEVHRAQVMHKMAARHLSELVRMSIESMSSYRVPAR
ncbi:response regulator transcription factor [Roseateles sp.]|uniref:response regulator transcription factor n=1 Tax=Roseateles sp. TaxID=1971397 RepID=UPI00286A04B8|nr:LuxR C-terminal-related transcriptional regulator [Roseateles sp.]